MKFKIVTIILTFAILLGLSASAYAEDYTIKLIAEPVTGGTVTGQGDYKSGKNATLTAVPAQGYTFLGWFKPGEDVPFSTTPQFVYDQEKSRTYIAKFEKEVSVGAIAEPAVAGSVTQNGSGAYPVGSEVTLIAKPNEGYAFLGWFDASSPVEPIHRESLYSFKVVKPVSYIAKFAKRFRLDVNISPEEGGTISGTGVFTSGSIVMLEAQPAKNYRFLGWANPAQPDKIISSDAKYAFNLDSDLTLTAKFGRSFGYVFLRMLYVLGIVAAVVAIMFIIFKHLRKFRRRRMRNGDSPRKQSVRKNRNDI